MASPEETNLVSRSAIDREKTTPFLLRLFVRTGGFHRLEDFEIPERLPVEDEVQIYTWKDTTLAELGRLLASAVPSLSRPNARLSFRLLFTDSYRPRVILRDVGTVFMSPDQGEPDAGAKTLEDIKYVIGDWIDVAVFTQSSGGPPSRSFDGQRGGSFGRDSGRERGRGDSYRGGTGRGREGRNGFDADRDRDRDRDIPSGPRRDRDRDRGGRW